MMDMRKVGWRVDARTAASLTVAAGPRGMTGWDWPALLASAWLITTTLAQSGQDWTPLPGYQPGAGGGRDPHQVVTASGAVRGGPGVTRAGTEYIAFKGIPYAEPPVGGLRLVDPVPVQPWRGQLDAREEPERPCLQPDTRGGVLGTEDW